MHRSIYDQLKNKATNSTLNKRAVAAVVRRIVLLPVLVVVVASYFEVLVGGRLA